MSKKPELGVLARTISFGLAWVVVVATAACGARDAGLASVVPCSSQSPPAPASSLQSRGASDRVTAPLRAPLVPEGAHTPIDPQIKAMITAVDEKRVDSDIRVIASFGTRHSLSAVDDPARGIGAARRFLDARFREVIALSRGRLSVEVQDFTAPKGPRVPKPWPMSNVVAILPGTDAGPHARTIVLSGHYDSRATDAMDGTSDAPGANDDASGVAVALEACRVMAPYAFGATIVFAAVAGEEQGLLGSADMVSRARKAGTRVEAMITNDIVGASVSEAGERDTARVRLFSAGLPSDATARDALLKVGAESDGPSRQLARAVREAAAPYVDGFEAMLVFRLDRYLRGGDHKPFHEAGFPAVRFTEVHEDFRHQHQDVRTADGVAYGDRVDYVDPAYVANVTRLNVAAIASLGRAPPAPAGVRIDTRDLAASTTLLWQPAADAGVSHYEVVARSSEMPAWTLAFPVPPGASSAKIDLSKDHFIFGLRAVGSGGHRSMAAFPLPLAKGDAWPPE